MVRRKIYRPYINKSTSTEVVNGCGKKGCYASKRAADKQINYLNSKHRHSTKFSYYCAKCQFWHLSSTSKY